MWPWRDLVLIAIWAALAATGSAAYAAVAVVEPRYLGDLPWIDIVGALGLAMGGGLVSALRVARRDTRDDRIAISIFGDRLVLDLGAALLAGLAAYGANALMDWGPYSLLLIGPITGYLGTALLDRIDVFAPGMIDAMVKKWLPPWRPKQ